MAALDKLNHGVAQRLVAYGTSLSSGRGVRFWRRAGGAWVGQLREQLASLPGEATVTSSARWGADSRWGVANLSQRVLAHAPDIVFLEFAINDADRRRDIPVAESHDNLARMLDRIHAARPACEIFPMVMHTPRGHPATVRPALEDYYDACRTVSAERHHTLIDHAPAWHHALRTEHDWQRYLPDDLHPSPSACRDIVLPTILSALGVGPR